MKKILTILIALALMLSMIAMVAAQEQKVMPVTTKQVLTSTPTDANPVDAGINEVPVDDEANNVSTDMPEVEVSQDDLVLEDGAGITPDSLLWGLERAMEKVNLAFTFDKAKKAEKRLNQATERLAEVNQMLLENKVQKAEKAQKKHDKILDGVEEDLADLENNVDKKSLEESAAIEAKLNEHQAIVERIGETKLKVKGLSDEDQQMLQNMVESLGNSTGKLQVEVMQQKERVKVKVKATEGLSDEDMEKLETQLTEKYGDDVKFIGKPDKADKIKPNNAGDDDDDEVEVDNEVNESDDDFGVNVTDDDVNESND